MGWWVSGNFRWDVVSSHVEVGFFHYREEVGVGVNGFYLIAERSILKIGDVPWHICTA
jgi:hypothetical protein